MRKLVLPFAALLMLTLAGCATSPRHEYDSQARFSEFRSFSWLAPEHGEREVSVSHPVLDSPLLGQRVRQAATNELQERGFVQVEKNPDFLVTYHTAEKEDQQRSGTYMQLGYGYRSHASIFGPGVLLDLTPRSFQEGTLIIDIVDARSNELVWRGWNDAVLNQRNFDQERVNEAVDFILSAFPPGNKNP